jgi:hypothetical protein
MTGKTSNRGLYACWKPDIVCLRCLKQWSPRLSLILNKKTLAQQAAQARENQSEISAKWLAQSHVCSCLWKRLGGFVAGRKVDTHSVKHCRLCLYSKQILWSWWCLLSVNNVKPLKTKSTRYGPNELCLADLKARRDYPAKKTSIISYT